MKVALVGVGGMGGGHLSIYQKMEDVEISALVDIDTEKVKSKIPCDSIRVYSNIDDMLSNEKVDFVDICSPSYLHKEHAIKAMDAGFHVLCEKPVAVTVEDAEAMVAAAKRNNVLFMVAHVIRFWPEYAYLKGIFDQKPFGELYHAEFSRISEIPKWSWDSWFLDQARSGRAPVDFHIHDTDFILYLLGKPDSVDSFGREIGSNISYINTRYKYGNTLVQSECGWFNAPIPFSMGFRLSFERAVMQFTEGKLIVSENGKEPYQVEVNSQNSIHSGINVNSADGYYSEIKYFIQCIKDNTPPKISTPESSLESLKMVYSELESIRTGKPVIIE